MVNYITSEVDGKCIGGGRCGVADIDADGDCWVLSRRTASTLGA
jgi:hypothetical protein